VSETLSKINLFSKNTVAAFSSLTGANKYREEGAQRGQIAKNAGLPI
jgi:hypothetical protein